VFSCSGVYTAKAMDVDWLPVGENKFEPLFKIGD
jgi:hypothetical protein